MEDLAKKYRLKNYRWDVSGIETNGYVIRKLGNNRYMITNEIVVVELNGIPYIEHISWIEVDYWYVEYKLKELKKQWDSAVMKVKEYRIKQKLERIDDDF